MNAWTHVPDAALFAAVYVVALLVLAVLNSREFKRCPEEGSRYRALPIRYKAACWFFVVPLFAGTILQGPLFIPALVSFSLLEVACVRWYRKAGLLPS